MKLFRKDKKQKQKNEQEESLRLQDMPPPPALPNQDPRFSQREIDPQMGQDSRYSQRVQHYDAPPPSEDPRHSHQRVQKHDVPPLRQQQDPRYSEQQGYDGPPPGVRQSNRSSRQSPPTREVVHHAASLRQQASPQQQQQQQHHRSAPAPRRSSPPQEFKPTQAPPKKEKTPPVITNVDPVEQMERAAVTRELVKQYVADVWNRGEMDLIPKICAKGLRFNGSAGMDRVGHEGFARMVETIRGSLEDYHCEIHSMVVEGNKAFCRMRFTGRHTGQLLGYEATGKHVSWMGASEFTVVDGLIVKVWELGDMSSLEHQLREAGGVAPAMVDGKY